MKPTTDNPSQEELLYYIKTLHDRIKRHEDGMNYLHMRFQHNYAKANFYQDCLEDCHLLGLPIKPKIILNRAYKLYGR